MEAAAQRLNRAFQQLEGRLDLLKQQVKHHPEIELLEQENRQLHEELMVLHEENQRLQAVIEDLGAQLDDTIEQVETLMRETAGEVT